MESKYKKTFKNFTFHGVIINAYINEKNEVKKESYHPKKDLYNDVKHYYKNIYCKGILTEPNSISINCSNLTTIDIDDPVKCDIIDKLLKDCNFIIKTRKGYHFYFNKDLNNLPRNYRSISKIADINLDNLFFSFEYKNKDNNEIYKYEIIKNEELNDIPKYAINWINNLINIEGYIKKNNKLDNNKLDKNKNNIVIKPDIVIDNIDIDKMDIIYNIFYENKYFDNFESWRKVAYMSKHLNNSNKSFKLFHKYSKNALNYKNIEDCIKCFYTDKYDLNFNINGVLYLCYELNPKQYKKIQFINKSFFEKDFNYIKYKYLYNDETKQIFDNWITDFKCLMCKSQYGTGKTYTFKKIIDSYKLEKILFITYRQSLAYSFKDELKEKYNFAMYLDISKDEYLKQNRLIIQLDSIHKLDNIGYRDDYLLNQDNIPKYDLIVMDEIEGILNHLSFKKIDQFYIYNVLSRLLNKSNKILCLDGDLCDRSYDFIYNLGIDYKIYINEYKTTKKHYILTNDTNDFNNKIMEKLNEGKKIVLCCMSKNETELYYELFKNNYKCIIHNSISKNKDILLNVNKHWADIDILIYSPTVEAGIDFNIEYFDCLFTTISNMSCSIRAFLQMMNRIRHYADNKIYCNVPKNIKMKTNDILMNYNLMKNSKWKNIENNGLTNILIYNDVEKYNSFHFTISYLIYKITEKGHTYEIQTKNKFIKKDEEEYEGEKITGKDLLISNMLNTNDNILCENMTIEDEKEYYKNIKDEIKLLINKQKLNNELTRDENFKLLKYIYIINFLNPKVDEKFLKTNLYNLDILRNFKNINTYNNNIDNTKYLDKIEQQKLNKVKELFNILNYDINNFEINKINNITEYTIDEIMKKKLINFLNDKNNKIILNIKNDLFFTYKNYLKKISEIISNYGYFLENTRKKITEEGKRKNITIIKNIIKKKFIQDYLINKSKLKNKNLEYEPEFIEDKNIIYYNGVDLAEIIKALDA